MTMIDSIRALLPRSRRRRPSSAGASKRRARGVTLVEVLIVVAILALIAGGVAIFAIPQFQQAQVKQAKTDTQNLMNALDTFRMQHGPSECPTVEQLKNEKILKPDQNINDPWNKPYVIKCNDGDSVMSYGPDGKDGTEDDIYSGAKPK